MIQSDPTPPAPAYQGLASVRFIHLATSTPAVDIGTREGLIFGGYRFGWASQYVAVPAGTYDILVFRSGTTTVLSTLRVTLQSEKVYTGVALGSVSNGSFFVGLNLDQ